MIGVFFMGLMKNVLIISRFSSEWQGIVLGAALIVAVAMIPLSPATRFMTVRTLQTRDSICLS